MVPEILGIRGFWTKTLKLHGFFEKYPFYYISINLTKCGFALHGFFLEPKTAYLEALLYFEVKVSILIIWGTRLSFKIVLSSKISYPAVQLLQQLKCINRGRRRLTLLFSVHNSLFRRNQMVAILDPTKVSRAMSSS